MFTFSVECFLEVVIPTVIEWNKVPVTEKLRIEDLVIKIEEVTPGYDENKQERKPSISAGLAQLS